MLRTSSLENAAHPGNRGCEKPGNETRSIMDSSIIVGIHCLFTLWELSSYKGRRPLWPDLVGQAQEHQPTLVAIINLFQSSLLAALPGRLNSILFRRTGYPKKIEKQVNNSVAYFIYHQLEVMRTLIHWLPTCRKDFTCHDARQRGDASVNSYKTSLVCVAFICRQNLLHL